MIFLLIVVCKNELCFGEASGIKMKLLQRMRSWHMKQILFYFSFATDLGMENYSISILNFINNPGRPSNENLAFLILFNSGSNE